MAESIIILGPQGCGKTLNAAALAKAYGFNKWCDADDRMPKSGHLILAHYVTTDCKLRVVDFCEAIRKIPNPHPATPRPTTGVQPRRSDTRRSGGNDSASAATRC